jgi:hypothetical protein
MITYSTNDVLTEIIETEKRLTKDGEKRILA